jgi:hypothetical protein
MAISRSVGVWCAVFLIAGAAAGAFGGFYFGAEWLLNRWVAEQAGDVKGDIEVLKLLRAGNAGQAIEMLETRLDDDLVILEPEGYRITRDTRAEMHGALRAAQQYRTEQPRKSKRTHVDEMVRNVLQRRYP